MASSAITIARCCLRTVARSVSPFSATPTQVKLGTYNVAAATNLFQDLVSTGPWLFIKGASGSAQGQTLNAQFTVKCDLLSGFAGDTSNEFTTSDDIVANLVKAFTAFQQWVHGKPWEPYSITWSEPSVISKLKPVVVSQEIACTFRYISDQAYNAVVLNGNNDVVLNGSGNLVFVG